jgi:hypothetical protein
MPYKDPEKKKAWNKAWRERNPEYSKIYYQENKEHISFISRYNQALAMGIIKKPKPIKLIEKERKSKRKFYKELKQRPCEDCHKQFPSCAMDFDHVRGQKLFGISENTNYSFEDLVTEVEKCDIICSNCHRIRTEERRGPRKPHRVRMITERIKFIDSCKDVPCMDCQGKFPPVAMTFFHVRGKKMFSMFQARYKDTMLIIEEMEKCDIICHNCNRIRTRNLMLKKPTDI